MDNVSDMESIDICADSFSAKPVVSENVLVHDNADETRNQQYHNPEHNRLYLQCTSTNNSNDYAHFVNDKDIVNTTTSNGCTGVDVDYYGRIDQVNDGIGSNSGTNDGIGSSKTNDVSDCNGGDSSDCDDDNDGDVDN